MKSDNKLVCCICNKTLHLTAECKEFDKKSIDALIKIKENLIHICNACKPQKDKFLRENFQEGTNQQMKVLTKSIEKSSNIFANIQNEVKTVKKNTKTYKPSLQSEKSTKENQLRCLKKRH